MATQIIVLNGGSSSGKSGIARCLQAILPDPWLSLSIDDLIDAMPPSLVGSGSGVTFGEQGEVEVGEAFHTVAAAWMSGIAEMARRGAHIIVDDVFLSGAASQDRMRVAFDGLEVLWVGVHCAPDIAAARELARGDRVGGMAASQATIAHEGVVYDLEVDTGRTEALECARVIVGRIGGGE